VSSAGFFGDRQSRKEWILVSVAAVVTTLLFLAPLLPDLGTFATGIRLYDGHHTNLFVDWCFAKSLWDTHSNPFYSAYYAYPFGMNVSMGDCCLAPVLTALLKPLGGIRLRRHLVLLGGMIFSFIASFALIRRFVNHTASALLGAVLTCYHMITSDLIYLDSSSVLLWFGFIPLFILTLSSCFSRGVVSVKKAVTAGILLFLCFATSGYYVYFGLILAVVLYGSVLVEKRFRAGKETLTLAVALGTAFALFILWCLAAFVAAPGGRELAVETVHGQAAVPDVESKLLSFGNYEEFKDSFLLSVKAESDPTKDKKKIRKQTFSTPVRSLFFLPDNLRTSSSDSRYQKSFYLGYVRLALVIAGLVLGGRKMMRWGVIAVLFFLLGLGSPVQVGQHQFPLLLGMMHSVVPGASFLTLPGRFFVVFHLAGGMLAAVAMRRFFTSKLPVARVLGILLVVAVVAETAYSAWYLRFNAGPIPMPDFYAAVAADPEECALFELYPPEVEAVGRTGVEIMFSQTVHGKAVPTPIPIFYAALSRIPLRLLLSLLSERLAYDKEISGVAPLSPDDFSTMLQKFRVKYLVLHFDLFNRYLGFKLRRILEEDFGPPLKLEGEKYLFQVYREHQPGPLQSLLARGLDIRNFTALVEQSSSFHGLFKKLLDKLEDNKKPEQ